MRKVLLVFTIVLTGMLMQAQTLKGVTIGEVYKGDALIDKDEHKYFETTVGGLDGKLIILESKDGTVLGVLFRTTGEVNSSDIPIFIKGVSKKYNIELNKADENSYGGTNGDTNCMLIVSNDDWSFSFTIVNLPLLLKEDEAHKAKAMDDF